MWLWLSLMGITRFLCVNNMVNSEKALAIVNVLIFIIIFTILSGVLLSLLSSHTRFLEENIRRTKGYYASEAASVAAFDSLRRTGTQGPDPTVGWLFTKDASNPTAYSTRTVSITNATSGALLVINATTAYSNDW